MMIPARITPSITAITLRLKVPIMAVIYYVVDRIVRYCLRRRGIPVEEIDYNKLDEIDRDTNKPVYRKEDGERKKKREKKQAG